MATRTYSTQTKDALKVMGQLISLARKEAEMTAQALAERAGISRSLLHRIEKGDPKCEIGVAFELATLLRIRLFSEEIPLPFLADHLEARIAVLPKIVRVSDTKKVSNDF